MDNALFESQLVAFRVRLRKYYEANLPKHGYSTEEYESVRDDAIRSLLDSVAFSELHPCYIAFMDKIGEIGSKALTEKEGDAVLERGHRVWAATGQVSREFAARAYDKRRYKGKVEKLPMGIKHKPRVAARLIRMALDDAGENQVFIPDSKILERFSEIAAKDWEDAILSHTDYDIVTCEHGFLMTRKQESSEEAELKESIKDLQKAIDLLKLRLEK